MARRRTTPERRADGAAIVRRAPFSDNPEVGIRGQRTQQRILDAALRVFADDGYHAASIDRIAKVAGCSRVSFYQYFASKEDVFGHLAAQLARQVTASIEALDPLTPDSEGWAAMRSWVTRYAEIDARYEPVFHAYQAVVESDAGVAVAVAQTGEETVARVRSRFVTTTLPPRQLDPVIRMLLQCLNHTFDVVGILRSVAPDAYPDERVEIAITDVLHRTLFGLRAGVNAHAALGAPSRPLGFSPEMVALLQDGEAVEPADNATLRALLDAGRTVFAERGYHGTRVDDVVTVARILNAHALRAIGTTVMDLPDTSRDGDAAARTALRRWLRRFNRAQSDEAAMLRVWVDAALQDPALRAESAPPLDWGRRRMSRYLAARGFGDPDMDAVVMVALLGVFGGRRRSAPEVEAAAHVIERGLLGR
jgi:AcrR family transcriptional regulator